jgi:hypothetical protein
VTGSFGASMDAHYLEGRERGASSRACSHSAKRGNAHPHLPDCNGPHTSASGFFHCNQIAFEEGVEVWELASNHGIDEPQDGLEGG